MCLLFVFWYTCNNVHEGGCLHPAVGKALERLSAEHLGSLALVVFEEVSKPFTTPHRACTLWVLTDHREEEYVALPLMIPLVMLQVHNSTPIIPNCEKSVTHGIRGTAARS
jgi:hypothetical protein